MEHMDIIAAWCKVLAVKAGGAIWYEDGGYKYADIFEGPYGWASYSCNTREEWEMFSEGI